MRSIVSQGGAGNEVNRKEAPPIQGAASISKMLDLNTLRENTTAELLDKLGNQILENVMNARCRVSLFPLEINSPRPLQSVSVIALFLPLCPSVVSNSPVPAVNRRHQLHKKADATAKIGPC